MRRFWYLLVALGLLLLVFWPSSLHLGLPSLGGGAGPPAERPSPAEGGQEIASALPAPKAVGSEDAVLLGNAGQLTRGAVVTFEGHGYRPGEAVVLLVEGSSARVGQTVADEHGDFYGLSYGVAAELPNGPQVVVAIGAQSGRTGRTRFSLQANPPWLKLGQETAKPGHQVVAQGGSFLPGEEVSLYLDSVAGRPLASAQAGRDGLLPATQLEVPSAPKGDHFIVAVGASGRFPVRAPLYVLGFNPWVEMTNYTPQAEALFGFVGYDFAPGEQVRVYLDQTRPGQLTAQPLAAVPADGQGKVDAPDVLRLPATMVGKHTLVALGAQTQQLTTADFEVMPFGPGLELSRYAGRVGTEVGFVGSYFAPGETLHAYLGKPGAGREVTTFQADDRGAFRDAGRFVLPTDLGAGNVTLSVLGERSLAPTSVVFTILPLEPGIDLSQRFGAAGAQVTFQGWGFAADEPVRIARADGSPVAEAQADADGNFHGAGPYRIPADARDAVPFVAEGERSHGHAEVAFTLGEESAELKVLSPEREPGAQDSGLSTQHSALSTQDSGLSTQDSGLSTPVGGGIRMRPTWRHLVALAVLALVALDVALGSALSADDREAAEQFARDALRPVADVLARPAVLQECRADPAHLPPSPPRPDGRPSSYYHTCRGRLADADGAVVQIVGVNWFGMETESYVPHGLWARNWRAVLDQVALLGFNTIRLPFSNEALVEGRMPSGIDYELNPDLEGKTSLEVLDMLVDGAAERGLKVILDRHRPTPEGQSELWYTPAVSEERWIADWVKLAQRYRGHDTVIGVDLHNEPRGAATWGSGDLATDWRLAAERAGNAILEANPYLLVFVQGVERYGDDWYWWGGNLRGVRDAPIRLQVPGRLVYSPHLYGPSVYPQSWFQAADFPRNLPLVWNAHWGYVAREGLAPVVLGEFGARSAGDDADGKWQQTLMDYLHRYGIGWINWSLNPNSDDTGGLLGDDWQTVLGQKAQLYRAYAAAPPASGSAEGSEASGGRLVAKVRSSIVDEQSSTLGFVVQVVNDGPEPVKLRDLELRYWFTPELLGASTQQVEVDYAAVGTRNVQAEIEPAGPLILNWSKDLRPAQDERGLAYVKLTFTDAAGALQPYTAGGDILVRVHKSDWSPYRQSNDFSFKPDGELGDWDHVTLYRDGERVWGVEPESADGRRQPAADSGQPAAGGRDRWWMRASEPEGEE